MYFLVRKDAAILPFESENIKLHAREKSVEDDITCENESKSKTSACMILPFFAGCPFQGAERIEESGARGMVD